MARAINTRGQLGNIQGIILTIIVIVVAVGAAYFVLGSFLSETQDIVGNDTATTAINNTLETIDIIPGMMPVIILIIMVIIILALVFMIPGSKSGGGA